MLGNSFLIWATAALVAGGVLWPAGVMAEEAAPAAAEPTPTATAASRALPRFNRVERTLPTVPSGFDGVVYAMTSPWAVEVGSPEQWERVEKDTNLTVGHHVRTNEMPEARLRLRAKEDELRLPKESHIELRNLTADAEEVTIFLHSGSIWSDVARRANPDSFVVETPELTAGVRGTNFRVDRGDGGARVSVFSGQVHVQARATGVFVTINANESAVVNLSGQILDLVATPVDEAAIWDEWEQWAMETALGTGSMIGAGPIGNLSQQIAADNARWETDMREYMQTQALLKYAEKIDEYAGAFMRFAGDTGVIPTDTQGWSLLRFDTGLEGWQGPYIEGPIPPLDPWRRPLKYVQAKGATGRVFGRVYSFGADGRDQGGHASHDIVSNIMYFQLPRFADDPEVNPQ